MQVELLGADPAPANAPWYATLLTAFVNAAGQPSAPSAPIYVQSAAPSMAIPLAIGAVGLVGVLLLVKKR